MSYRTQVNALNDKLTRAIDASAERKTDLQTIRLDQQAEKAEKRAAKMGRKHLRGNIRRQPGGADGREPAPRRREEAKQMSAAFDAMPTAMLDNVCDSGRR
jgi:hypothetical protein